LVDSSGAPRSLSISTTRMMLKSESFSIFSIRCQEVSKPFEDGEHASQVEEALEQVGVVFSARDEPAEIVEPAETAFDPVIIMSVPPFTDCGMQLACHQRSVINRVLKLPRAI
jgi:hypothetical protein